MSYLDIKSLDIDDRFVAPEKPPISRETLALFAGASGDHNPIHIDIDVARQAGLPDVFAHGMLSMAYLAQALLHWVPQASICSYSVRFKSITHLGDRITCSAKVVERIGDGAPEQVRLELVAANQQGEVKLLGEAIVSAP